MMIYISVYQYNAIFKIKMSTPFLQKIMTMKKGFFNILLPESANDAVGILLYGYIGNEEKIDSATIVAKIKELSLKYRNIDIRINSLGGEVYAGLAIFNAIRESEANINIYIDGVAASMAAVIALCGRPLHMSRYSRLMLHSVSGGVSGTAKYIRTYADQIDSLTNTLIEIVSERTGLGSDEVRDRWFDGNDHWITSSEAMSLKLIDSIYDMKNNPTATESEELTAECIYEFTNRLSEPQLDNQNMNFMEELRNLSSFSNAKTDVEVLEVVKKLENAAAKVEPLEKRVNDLLAEKEVAINSAREAFLAQAIQEGKIKDSQKEQFLALMKSDEKTVKELIASMPITKRTPRIAETLATQAGQSARAQLEAMSWDEIDRAERLAELKNNYPDLYEAKFNETFKK